MTIVEFLIGAFTLATLFAGCYRMYLQRCSDAVQRRRQEELKRRYPAVYR